MPDEFQKYRERFLPKRLEMNVDGHTEEWIYETNQVDENKLFVIYKLKGKGKYKTDV